MSFNAKSRAAPSSDSLVSTSNNAVPSNVDAGTVAPETIMLTAAFQAHETRETLGSAGTGNEPELDLRKGDLGVGEGHPIVAAERELEAAAHAGAADCGHHRLVRRFDDIHHRGQKRLGIERVAGEFLDVGAARERALVADDHHDANLGIRERAIERIHDTCAQRVRQRIQRWIVHREPRDALFDFVADDGHAPIISTAARARRSGKARNRAVYSLTRRQAPCLQRQNMLQPNNVQ